MSLNLNDYVVFGAFRSIAGFPLEHPLEVVKLKSQGMPNTPLKQIIKTIYSENNGLKGFYDGALSNLAKRTVRVSYRWPTVATLHSLWDGILPKTFKDNKTVTYITTSTSIAAVETFLVLPLERLFVSQVNASGYKQFLKNQFKYEGISSLYRGSAATFLNHSSSWSVFMMTNHFVNREYLQIDPKTEYPILGRVGMSAIIAANLTVVDLPLDFTKTQIQMHSKFQKMSTYEVIKVLYKEHGIKGFYSGATCALAHKCIQTIFGSAFFNEMTNSSKATSQRGMYN